MLRADSRKDLLTGDSLGLSTVELVDATLGLIRPKTLNLFVDRQIEAGEQLLHET